MKIQVLVNHVVLQGVSFVVLGCSEDGMLVLKLDRVADPDDIILVIDGSAPYGVIDTDRSDAQHLVLKVNGYRATGVTT